MPVENGVDGYLWHISTKYYDADVNLCTMANKGLVSQQLASTVQAVIIYFDSTKVIYNLHYILSTLGSLQ